MTDVDGWALALSVGAMVLALGTVALGVFSERRRRREARSVKEAFEAAGVDYEAARRGVFRRTDQEGHDRA